MSPEVTPVPGQDATIDTNLEAEKLRIDRERLEIDKAKARYDQKFLNRNLGTIITALVSLAAVGVSVAQIWVAQISRDKEIQVAREQKEKEIIVSREEKEKELTILSAQQEREWNLEVAKFVSEHSDAIFGGTEEQRSRLAKVMAVTFPPYVMDALFQKLEKIPSPPQTQNVWQDARKGLIDENRGVIRGIVLGKSRTDFVEGATVEIRDLQGLVRTRTKTDSKGSFQFNVPVSPGGTAYRILVHAEGYSLSTMFTNVLLGDNPTVLIPLGFILPPVGVSGVVG